MKKIIQVIILTITFISLFGFSLLPNFTNSYPQPTIYPANQINAGIITGTLPITQYVYLPIAYKNYTPPPTATPIPTSTVQPTATSTPQPTATSTTQPTATPTIQPTASQADIRITYIEYNPPGLDGEGEYVDLKNFDTITADMTNWTLYDEANNAYNTYTFPNFSLAPQATVRVWVRSGTNNATNLYWGKNAAVWNNTGDSAFLDNNVGTRIDQCSYAGGGVGIACE